MYVCYVDGKSLDEKSNIQLGALRSNECSKSTYVSKYTWQKTTIPLECALQHCRNTRSELQNPPWTRSSQGSLQLGFLLSSHNIASCKDGCCTWKQIYIYLDKLISWGGDSGDTSRHYIIFKIFSKCTCSCSHVQTKRLCIAMVRPSLKGEI